MDKWKVVAILALIFGLGGYGWYSTNMTSPTAPPQPTPEAPTPEPPTLVGKPVPQWDIPAGLWTNTPKPVSVADVKGSVTLVEFFRISCPHCQEAAPFMEKTYKRYKPLGLKMLAIQSPSLNDPKESDWPTVNKQVHEWGVTYPVGFDEGGKIFREKYHLGIFPTVIVLDKDGVVRYLKSGYTAETAQQLTAYLDSVLSPSKTTKPSSKPLSK